MASEKIGKEKVSLNVARYKKDGEIFEVAVDPDVAMSFKSGQSIDIREVLKSEQVFNDVRRGLVSSQDRLKAVFDTVDPLEIAEIIIKKGEIQLTTEYRAQIREGKKNQILNIIHKNGVDPKTHLPHPMTRLQGALEEAKVKIDESRSAEEQVQDVLKAMRVVLPIKFEIKEIVVRIPTEFAPKMYGSVKHFGKLLSEEWQTDGSWICVIELPAGLEVEFYDKMNSLTQGSVETKVLKTR